MILFLILFSSKLIIAQVQQELDELKARISAMEKEVEEIKQHYQNEPEKMVYENGNK